MFVLAQPSFCGLCTYTSGQPIVKAVWYIIVIWSIDILTQLYVGYRAHKHYVIIHVHVSNIYTG